MAGNLAAQIAIRSIMRVLPRDVAERALAEMEAERHAFAHSCESYDLGVIIAAIKTDLGIAPCRNATLDKGGQAAPH